MKILGQVSSPEVAEVVRKSVPKSAATVIRAERKKMHG